MVDGFGFLVHGSWFVWVYGGGGNSDPRFVITATPCIEVMTELNNIQNHQLAALKTTWLSN